VNLHDGVRVEGLWVRYGEVQALRGINLEVELGQLVAVLGPSGAGKSSLLWAIVGAVPAADGKVTIGDTVIGSRLDALAEGAVLVPQGNGLAGILTALENVTLPLVAGGAQPAEAHTRAMAALEQVGLEESRNHLIEELSGGQQQRVAVARALAGEPRVILADEPASDLDAMNRARVNALLRQHADRGAAVVMTTHDPEVAEVADRVLHLDVGRFVD
jgi:putative ABC transport system ATP-binding protein